jgi:hypothetical protein
MKVFPTHEMIDTPEAGAVALLTAIIFQSMEDIRAHLCPGDGHQWARRERSDSKTSLIEKQCEQRRRAVFAQEAAHMLQYHSEGLFSTLRMCGVPITKERVFRQLARLKPAPAQSNLIEAAS